MTPSHALRSLLLLAPALGLLPSPAPAAPAQEGSRTVHVTRPTRTTIDRSVQLVGTVLPWQSMTVKSRVTGYVKAVQVMPGDRVKQGQVICTLDLPGLRAEEEAARAGVVEAEAIVVGKKGDIDAARADVMDARAAEQVAVSLIAVRSASVTVAAAEVQLAQAVFNRKKSLYESKAATLEEVEQAEGELARASAQETAANADVSMAVAKLQAASARTDAAKARVAGAEAQVAAAAAGVKTAQAELARITSELAFGELRCPYEEALVTRRSVDPGALALANQTELLMLMDVSRVRLKFHVPERIARIVKPGTRVVLSMDDDLGESIDATVSRIAGALDTGSRTMQAEVDLENSAGALFPGMFFHARVSVEKVTDALVLPGSAVHTQRKQNYVLVVDEGGMVSRKNVKLGVDDGRQVQVVEGLTGTEQVVRSLVAGLREGDRVTPVEGN